jgi:hypothetical protein
MLGQRHRLKWSLARLVKLAWLLVGIARTERLRVILIELQAIAVELRQRDWLT